jgi:hypothetical protein
MGYESTDCHQGPGNCLGLLAAKSSPTAVRGQFYGLAAAVGKIGAFVGVWGVYSYHCLISYITKTKMIQLFLQ